MQNITHVLTSPQSELRADTEEASARREAARKNIGAVAGAKVGENPVSTDSDGYIVLPDASLQGKGIVKLVDSIDTEERFVAVTPKAVQDAMSQVGGYKVVEAGQDGKPNVPLEERSPNYIYLTEDPSAQPPDYYKEWIWDLGDPSADPPVAASWKLIGTTSPDLRDFVHKVSGGTPGNVATLTNDESIADSTIAGTDVADAVDKKHSHSNKATLDDITAAYTTEEKTKLTGIEIGAQENVIESISVNDIAVEPDASKNVNIRIPKAVPDPVAPNQMLFSADGVLWAPVTWEMEYFDSVLIGGKVYRTVKIGNQEWMAENLDFRFDYNGEPLPLNNSGTSGSPAAYYYDYDNNGTYAHGGSYNTGLLYNWHAANYLNTNRSTLCPGWHVPSESELYTLFSTVGGTSVAGTKLKYEQPTWAPGWHGDDTYEFSALPSGVYTGNFTSIASELRLWSTTESAGTPEYAQYAYFSNANSVSLLGVYKYYGCSIRLVKDSV